MYFRLFIIALTVLLTGCGTIVETSTTTFHGADHAKRGTIRVFPVDSNQEKSLEFKAVSDYVVAKLGENGYVPVGTDMQPEFIAFLTYGIVSSQSEVSSVPIFGQTGGGTTFHSGSAYSGGSTTNFSGTSQTMRTYGVVGSRTVSSTVHRREVNLDIYRVETGADPKKAYEVRAVSRGSCGNINAVVRSIIDGIFKNFPGAPGVTRNVKTPLSADC